MKKILVVMVVALCFVLSSCGDKEEKTVIENISREETEPVKTDKTDVEKNVETEKEEVDAENKKEAGDEKTAEEPVVKNEPEAVALDTVRSEIKSSLGVSGEADLDADSISGLYGINAQDIRDAAGFVVMAGTFPHEVVMIEATDASAADRVESMLSAKHQSFVEQSKGYDAENYALAQKCKVVRKGNNLSLFLTPDFETMQNVYNKYIK